MRRVSCFCLLAAVLVPSAYAQTFAVLPFFDRTGNANWSWMGESVSESIGEAFASEGLLVTARTDREEVLRRLRLRSGVPLTQASVIRVAHGLDATHVISGHVEGRDGKLRLTASILDVKQLSAGIRAVVEGRAGDLALLEAQLAWQLLKTTLPGQSPSLEEYLRRYPPVRVDALERYVRGLLSPSDVDRIRHFGQASRLSPEYMPPVFHLGRTYLDRKQWQEAALWLARVTAQSPRYREAIFLLGIARFEFADYEGAVECFASIRESVPLSEVWNNLGAAQSRAGRADALSALEHALEGDPADPVYHFNVGLARLKRGDLDHAAERFRAVLDRDPGDREAGSLLEAAASPAMARRAAAQAVERIKSNYDESAYLQLKAILSPLPPH
jgi:tetratricopeptide (TPR) repeat protein